MTAALIGFAYGEHLDGPQRRSLGYRLLAPQPLTASLSSNLPVDRSQVVVAYPQIGLQATLYSTGITCSGSPVPWWRRARCGWRRPAAR